MDISRPWIAIVFIVILAGDALACTIPIAYIKDDLDRLGCSPLILRTIPVVKWAAVGGLIVGLWYRPLGIAACVGMLVYFGFAFGFHARARDTLVQYLPAVAFVLLILAALVFSYAA